MFKTPPVVIRNSASELALGIDVRGYHGYILLPPSEHFSGNLYQWVPGHAPGQIEAAAIPPWLLQQCVAPVITASRRRDWEQWIQRQIPEGERNAAVARLAGHLLYRRVDPDVALELALCWNRLHCAPPLSDSEVVGTVNSIAGSERRSRGRGRR